MRLTLILLLALAASSAEAQPADALGAAEEFANTVRSYQDMYMGGGDDDCDEIAEALDDDLVFQENGRPWTKAEMVEFCSHLPHKDVIDTVSSHELLTEDLAYDFVSQLYWARNREDQGLDALRLLLQRITACWPEVEFVSVDQLVKGMEVQT